MPSPEDILRGLTALSNEWRAVAIAWHAVVAVLLIAALAHRASERVVAAAIALMTASVAALAWAGGNPFNGLVFAGLAAGLLASALRMSQRSTNVESPILAVSGTVLLAFGFVYPHFLETHSWTEYAYAAPLGIVPCPTLSAAIGTTLLLGLFRSTPWAILLTVAGLLYGAIGVVRLGVTIDVGLLVGAAVLGTTFKDRISSAASAL
jgi:hypothetical protein